MWFKKIFIFSFLILFLPFVCLAQGEINEGSLKMRIAEQDSAFRGSSGYASETTVDSLVANIITMALSILGILFLILIIFSGYQWMTAGGNEEQVKKAQSRIKNAVIGIIIVVLAYSITAFIFKRLPGGDGQVQTTDPQNPG